MTGVSGKYSEVIVVLLFAGEVSRQDTAVASCMRCCQQQSDTDADTEEHNSIVNSRTSMYELISVLIT